MKFALNPWLEGPFGPISASFEAGFCFHRGSFPCFGTRLRSERGQDMPGGAAGMTMSRAGVTLGCQHVASIKACHAVNDDPVRTFKYDEPEAIRDRNSIKKETAT